jgi:hypothetical protein
MKTYEIAVLLLAPLGTGLAAFDHASGWDQSAEVARAAAPAPQPVPAAGDCPARDRPASDAGTDCTRVTSAQRPAPPVQADS